MTVKAFLIVLISVFSFPAFSGNGLTEVVYFGENPGNLKMYIHVPTGLGLKKNVPLVVALHGCSQSASSFSKQTGWNDLADKYGFIVVYPQQKTVNNASSCFNWFMRKDIQGEEGELFSIKNMIQHTRKRFSIDPEKVYVFGLSAGASMANSLMANYPELFNAGAVLAGGPHMSATNAFMGMKVMLDADNKSPEEWGSFVKIKERGVNVPKIIVYHGTEDNVVTPKNTEELIEQWSYVHQVDEGAKRVEKSYEGNQQVERIVYASKSDQESIIYYKLKGVGHKLAVDPGNNRNQGGSEDGFTIDIDFYATYYIAQDFGLIK